MARSVGVNVPLFSVRSRASWGIGELPDIVPLSAWLAAASVNQLMVLPLGTIPDGETSPYSATSTMSLDPIYVSVDALEDFSRAGGVSVLSEGAQRSREAARQSPVVLHDAVRRAKHEALGLAFTSFFTEEWAEHTTRAGALAAYVARERWWLDDYALFQALSRSMPGVSWRQWPAALRDRDGRALDDARRQFGREVLAHQYWQWIAEEQWQAARLAARRHGVTVVGDLPFVAGMESPEVWARAGEFMLDVSAGVPPDAFSDTGQDWGLPTYRWDAIRSTGYAWMHQRARRMAALYDGVRADHVIGLYRTYGRPPDGPPFFNPPDEASQVAQGEAVLTALKQAGLDVIAEDLGVVPDFLRPSLTRLGVPGCKVLRWERDWEADGEPFMDPASFPPVSAAMTGTHDTEPLALWWTIAAPADREALAALPLFIERGMVDASQRWTDALRDLLIELAYRSGSDYLFLPVQDLFGWRDRVNTPGTVGPENWTWCLPWLVDGLEARPAAVERAGVLRRLAAATGRGVASVYTKGALAR